MKVALFVLLASLMGLVYQNYEKAETSRKDLEDAYTQIEQLHKKVAEADPLRQQVAALQQQLVATAQQLTAVRQQMNVQRSQFAAAPKAPSISALPPDSPRQAGLGAAQAAATPTVFNGALDGPAQPTDAHINASTRRKH